MLPFEFIGFITKLLLTMFVIFCVTPIWKDSILYVQCAKDSHGKILASSLQSSMHNDQL
jgi:hypothetical protein